MTATEFAVEYEKSFNRTTGFLCKVRGLDHDAAEELSQAAWSRAWEKRIQWRGTNKFTSWVITIAVNLHLVQLRRKTVVNQLDEGYDIPVCCMDQLEMEMDAARMLRLCGQAHRKALESKYVDEKENLNNTERTQVRRAVIAVRKSLNLSLSMAAGAGA
jgi:DNA-directed RNA polymerase specialized sigma24 family protein